VPANTLAKRWRRRWNAPCFYPEQRARDVAQRKGGNMLKAVVAAAVALLAAGTVQAQSGEAPAPTPEAAPAAQQTRTVSPDLPLSLEERKALQRELQRTGHYRGPVNGELDPATREALRAFQKDSLIIASGHVTAKTLDLLGMDVLKVTGADVELVRGEDPPAKSKKAKKARKTNRRGER
jgi:peptidoglycan hydrolase-like protein with peptidoglycan-binding domain